MAGAAAGSVACAVGRWRCRPGSIAKHPGRCTRESRTPTEEPPDARRRHPGPRRLQIAAAGGGVETAGDPGPRCSPETLEPLAQSVETSHRLQVAEARVAETLAALPSDRWLVERYVLIAGHRIPFLVLARPACSPSGRSPDRRCGTSCRSPRTLPRTSPTLPGYTAPIRVGICRALAADSDRAALVVPRQRTGRVGDGTRLADPLDRALRSPSTASASPTSNGCENSPQPKPGPAARVPDVIPDLR